MASFPTVCCTPFWVLEFGACAAHFKIMSPPRHDIEILLEPRQDTWGRMLRFVPAAAAGAEQEEEEAEWVPVDMDVTQSSVWANVTGGERVCAWY